MEAGSLGHVALLTSYTQAGWTVSEYNLADTGLFDSRLLSVAEIADGIIIHFERYGSVPATSTVVMP